MNAFSSSTGQSIFDFVPDPTQDRELLQQLSFVPGVAELLTIRQVHALEHATVWVLSEGANTPNQRAETELFGGMSTEQGFYLYGKVETGRLRQAVEQGLRRLTLGEWDLAVHPRCGTNFSVNLLLTSGLAFGISSLLPKNLIEQLFGLGLATVLANQLAPDLGSIAQRYLTTAIPFNLRVVEISQTQDFWGRSAHFVRVQWVS
ncbi:conserved hypothetical protein [Planktothrix serta PCC 8927]|uniref:Uncharacterized protein n=1 Tax=Planktothrix serta PCC 8927 TaxID=671068 RepID=A0A7Z9BWK6_9CYAN|nr:DUF6391 domain-containing protein [Planktothrix serta]VXD21170.1 conserved hypothetical protein [Planktothrix serta PCC 8927]